MGAAQSAESVQESTVTLPEQQRLIGKIDATLLPLYWARVMLATPTLRQAWSRSEVPRARDLPEICRLLEQCESVRDQWIIYANEVAVWLFYNTPPPGLEGQAAALVDNMIETLGAWRTDPSLDLSLQIDAWQRQLEQLDAAAQSRRTEAVTRARAATQRPQPSVVLKTSRQVRFE